MTGATPAVGVVTIATGRHDHLRAQLEGLRTGSVLPAQHVVVSMGDPALHDVCAGQACHVVDGPSGPPLPLAAARNLGAAVALASGADLLVFLDVDCVPTERLLEVYAHAWREHPTALLSGPVTYLVEGVAAGPGTRPEPHPARPAPPDGIVRAIGHELFWSLSFAVDPAVWRRIGGFCEDYAGYGAEDTDFGQVAAMAGAPHLMVGGAHALHQWHPTQDPPVQHLDDLLRNGRIFARRWGWWPMQGWFAAFERAGLVTDGPDGWRRSAA